MWFDGDYLLWILLLEALEQCGFAGTCATEDDMTNACHIFNGCILVSLHKTRFEKLRIFFGAGGADIVGLTELELSLGSLS